MLNVDVSEIVLTMSISKKRWRNIAHDVIEPFFASLHTSRTRIKEIDWQQMVLLYFAIVVWTTDTNTLYCALDCDVSVLFVHRVLCVCVYWLYVYIVLWNVPHCLFYDWLLEPSITIFCCCCCGYAMFFFHYTISTFALTHCLCVAYFHNLIWIYLWVVYF